MCGFGGVDDADARDFGNWCRWSEYGGIRAAGSAGFPMETGSLREAPADGDPGTGGTLANDERRGVAVPVIVFLPGRITRRILEAAFQAIDVIANLAVDDAGRFGVTRALRGWSRTSGLE